jgi:hypothetical protein
VRADCVRGHLRATLLASTAALLAAAGGTTSSASAAVSASRITSPASPAYALYDETLAPHQPAFTVSGTTTGTGNVALRCYFGVGPNEYRDVLKEVTVSGGAFSVAVDAEALDFAPCVLRAVPVSDTKAHPPGSPTEEAKDPYQGPVIAGSRLEVESNEAVEDYYEFEARSVAGYFDIEAAGACGLVESALYAANSLLPSADLFGCDATFFEENEPSSGSSTRSDLQVDGADAYMPTTARYLEEDLATKIAGAPQISVTQTFDRTSGLVRIREVDPLVKCSPGTSFPPTKTSCKEFVSAGVQLERAWQTSSADRVALMTDNWSSTDGSAHTLSALYEQWFAASTEAGGAFEFPGTGAFAPTAKGELVALATGPGAIYYKEDSETPAGGDGEHPQGAIVYDRSPSEPLNFHESTSAGKKIGTEFNMPYRASIPASGTYTLRMDFLQSETLTEAQTQSEALESSFAPTLSIASPSSGATVSTPSVTLTGAATDTGALSSLTIAGNAVPVAANGAWSTSVALAKGPNTIAALATDQAGLTASQSIAVTYAPPATPAAPLAQASRIAGPHGADGGASVTLECSGAAGTSCEVRTSLTTVERTRGGKPVAVSARRAKLRSKRVSVGFSKVMIPAGRQVKITVALNGTGKRLLARFGHLPVHLQVVLVSAGQRSTIVARNLTIHRRSHATKARRKHRRRRRPPAR